ncbi:MAG: hypothetical protein ACJ8C4_07185 [Gemmataceae bacterium]
MAKQKEILVDNPPEDDDTKSDILAFAQDIQDQFAFSLTPPRSTALFSRTLLSRYSFGHCHRNGWYFFDQLESICLLVYDVSNRHCFD